MGWNFPTHFFKPNLLQIYKISYTVETTYKECARDKPFDHTATGKMYGAKA